MEVDGAGPLACHIVGALGGKSIGSMASQRPVSDAQQSGIKLSSNLRRTIQLQAQVHLARHWLSRAGWYVQSLFQYELSLFERASRASNYISITPGTHIIVR